MPPPVRKGSLFSWSLSTKMTESNYPPFPIPSLNPSAACDNNLTHAGQAFKLPLLIIFKNYNPRHIKLGHPVQLPYCGKTLCSFPPSAEIFCFFDANWQKPALRRHKYRTLPTNVTSIVGKITFISYMSIFDMIVNFLRLFIPISSLSLNVSISFLALDKNFPFMRLECQNWFNRVANSVTPPLIHS